MMNYQRTFTSILIMTGLFPAIAFANGENHLDPAASVVLWGTLILFFGLMGQYIAVRLKQPGVLGELLMGVIVGNICYFAGMQLAVILREGTAIFNIMHDMLGGVSLTAAVHRVIADPHVAQQVALALSGPDGVDWIKVAYVVDIFSRYGVIFLLFMVGLENSIEELMHTGKEAMRVAVIGVIAPIALGLGVAYLIIPGSTFKSNIFVAATLSATSVGITARVLKDMKKLRTREAKTILGAAMIDDILGLIILSIVSGIAIHGVINVMVVTSTMLWATLFFAGALLIGPWILRKTVKLFEFLDLWEAKLFTAFLFVMGLSWLASLVQLSTIIGAFVAGMIIHDGFFKSREGDHKPATSIKHLVAPFESIFAPLFFMLIGIQVKLETFWDWHVLLMATGLTIVAILGKLISGLGAARQDSRLLIGVGMLPRGEVGLVFASIGKSIGVISDSLFSAIILMVIVTTIIAPLWLKNIYSRESLAS
jgi:Kef-type K+ transport system membrane component KefB